MTITEFLLARIAEDEADARVMQAPNYTGLTSGWIGGRVGGTFLGHLARWAPARVLAECEAKRQLVERWGPFETYNGDDLLRVLAAAYADHPDYDEVWRP